MTNISSSKIYSENPFFQCRDFSPDPQSVEGAFNFNKMDFL